MKQLTDSERLEVAESVLIDHDLEGHYVRRCAELEHQPERNGFHNTPAECEDMECAECGLTDAYRRGLDCPYVD